MRLVALAFRLVRGGGAGGLVRFALMVAGIAVIVAALTLLTAIPAILGSQAATAGDRVPRVTAAGQDGQFRFSVVDDIWRNQRFTRVLVTEVRRHGPLPPGVAQLPLPGQTVLSPAAAALAVRDAEFAARVPGQLLGLIGPAGLLGPDELYAYVGTTPDRLDTTRPGAGFGIGASAELYRAQQGVGWEFGLPVLPASAVYLIICARLAASTRARRYAALRLFGLRQAAVRVVAATESALAGIAGGLVGLVMHRLLNEWLARSDLLGFTWHPNRGNPVLLWSIALVLGVIAVSAVTGVVGLHRRTTHPRLAATEVTQPVVRWWQLLPLALGLGLICSPLFFAPHTPEDTRRVLGSTAGWLLIISVVLVGLGMLLALRAFVVLAARLLSMQRFPLPARIAGHRLAHEPLSVLPLISALVLLVLVAGTSAGVLRDMALSAGTGLNTQHVRVEGETVSDPARRAEMFGAADTLRWLVQPSLTDAIPAGALDGPLVVGEGSVDVVPMITIPCARLRALTRTALPACRDGAEYRLVDAAAPRLGDLPPPESQLRYRTPDGGEAEYQVPLQVLTAPGLRSSPLPSASLLMTIPEPRFGWSSDLRLHFLVSGRQTEIDRFRTTMAAIAPSAQLQVSGENVEKLETYRVHYGALRFAVALAFALTILAFVVAALDRGIERRRDVVSLVVIGMPTWSIRLAQVLQITVPLLACLSVAVVVAHLAGNAVLQLNGRQTGWYLGTWNTTLPLLAVALTAGVTASCVLVGRRIRAEDLHSA